MKLKTWRQYWPNLCCSILFFFMEASFSKESPLGIIESLQTLVELDKKNHRKLIEAIKSSPGSIKQFSVQDTLKLDPQFMRSILLHSSESYLSIIDDRYCIFLALLENGLLRASFGLSEEMVVVASSKTKKKSMVISKKDFFHHVYRQRCFQNRQIGTLFELKNLKKTMDSLSFPIPKTHKECHRIMDNWHKNPYTPYLCSIPDIIERGEKAEGLLRTGSYSLSKQNFMQNAVFKKNIIKKNISFQHQSYLDNLCGFLAVPESFCQIYVDSHTWSKVANKELPEYLMSYRCDESPTGKDWLHQCAEKLNKNPSLCSSRRTPYALFPRPDCTEVSSALSMGNLKTDYPDCPSSSNFGVTNTHRLLMHLKGKKQSGSCSFGVNSSFISLFGKKSWPLKICYKDVIRKREKCRPYIPGYNPENSLSEGRVVADILMDIKDAPEKMTCGLIDKKEYNPQRLHLHKDCLIVYQNPICQDSSCPKEILYRGRKLDGITWRGFFNFDYFRNSYKNTSINSLLKDKLKVKGRTVRNLTEMRYLLDKGNIAHGVGCMEDIYPVRFKKRSLNDCHPLPFIIDGMTLMDHNTMFVVRTAMDDVHSPRFINWQFIYSAVTSYQKIHPLKTWMLHGVH